MVKKIIFTSYPPVSRIYKKLKKVNSKTNNPVNKWVREVQMLI
jgi:hypothetical protein